MDAKGHFVPSTRALALFDYFLSASGEEPASQLRARIVAEIERRLPDPAAGEASAFLDRYLAYRAEGARAAADDRLAESADLERRLQWIRELRRAHFGAELAETLFGDEERAAALALERRRIVGDASLTDVGASARDSTRSKRSARKPTSRALAARSAPLRLAAAGAGAARARWRHRRAARAARADGGCRGGRHGWRSATSGAPNGRRGSSPTGSRATQSAPMRVSIRRPAKRRSKTPSPAASMPASGSACARSTRSSWVPPPGGNRAGRAVAGARPAVRSRPRRRTELGPRVAREVPPTRRRAARAATLADPPDTYPEREARHGMRNLGPKRLLALGLALAGLAAGDASAQRADVEAWAVDWVPGFVDLFDDGVFSFGPGQAYNIGCPQDAMPTEAGGVLTVPGGFFPCKGFEVQPDARIPSGATMRALFDVALPPTGASYGIVIKNLDESDAAYLLIRRGADPNGTAGSDTLFVELAADATFTPVAAIVLSVNPAGDPQLPQKIELELTLTPNDGNGTLIPSARYSECGPGVQPCSPRPPLLPVPPVIVPQTDGALAAGVLHVPAFKEVVPSDPSKNPFPVSIEDWSLQMAAADDFEMAPLGTLEPYQTSTGTCGSVAVADGALALDLEGNCPKVVAAFVGSLASGLDASASYRFAIPQRCDRYGVAANAQSDLAELAVVRDGDGSLAVWLSTEAETGEGPAVAILERTTLSATPTSDQTLAATAADRTAPAGRGRRLRRSRATRAVPTLRYLAVPARRGFRGPRPRRVPAGAPGRHAVWRAAGRTRRPERRRPARRGRPRHRESVRRGTGTRRGPRRPPRRSSCCFCSTRHR